MSENNYSCIEKVEKTVHVALPMSYSGNPTQGVKEYLERWKCEYIPVLDGLVVDFKNVTFETPLGRIIYDQPYLHYNVKAEFSLFKPSVGSLLKGTVNRISREHVGCVAHNSINASIHISDDISSDAQQCIGIDNIILFEVTNVEIHKKVIRVEGKLTNESIELTRQLYPNQYSNHLFFEDEGNMEQIENQTFELLPNITESAPVSSKKRKRKSTDSTGNISLTGAEPNNSQDFEANSFSDSTPIYKPKKNKRKRAEDDSFEMSNVHEVSSELYLGPSSSNFQSTSQDFSQGENFSHSSHSDSGSTKKKKKKKKELVEDSFETSFGDDVKLHKKRKKKSSRCDASDVN